MHALVVDRHSEQRRTHPLAGGQQHVQFARRRKRGHGERQPHKLVGGVTHRRDHDDYVVAQLFRRDNPLGDPLDAFSVSHRRAADFCTAAQRLPSTPDSECHDPDTRGVGPAIDLCLDAARDAGGG
jgi:hypothetical protein